MNRISRTLVAAALVVAPIALASPAQAQTMMSGCTVTPEAPRFYSENNPMHEVMVDYPVSVSCNPAGAERYVHVREEQWTWDTKRLTGSTTLEHNFPLKGGTDLMHVYAVLPRTRPDNEVMYQRTQFKVNAAHVKGAYSDWAWSGWTRIWH